MTSLIVDFGAGPQSGDELAKPIRERIRQARDHRRTFEPTWHSNLAFAAGKHWLEWDRFQRALVMPSDLKDKELYTTDVMTEYRTLALSELGSDDDRPELLLRRDDLPSEDYQQQLNRAVAYGWDQEWDGDTALSEVDRMCVDLGTSAIRCRFDPDYGPVVQDNVPFLNGKPILNMEQASGLFENGPNPEVNMGAIRQGRICWEPESAFNLLTPPGVPHEKYFPWECVVRPTLLSDVQAEYGDVAMGLKEDTDIASLLGNAIGSGGDGSQYGPGGGERGRLRDHVWLFIYFEKPTRNYPQGRTVTLATNRLVPLRFEGSLPYRAPNGDWRSGITYFHWWRVSGRFWSRSLVEAMKDVQRGVNKRRTQINEIIDRSMPYIIVERDSNALNRTGTPMEFIEIERAETQPVPVQGVGPGQWMQQDVEAMREDLEHATGIKAVRLGENPANVGTYGQLALINENDQQKRQNIISGRKRGIARLVEDSVYDIRRYWGPQREIALAGDNDQVDAAIFNATQVPPFFIVRIAKGPARPRSEAAEIQKIQDIARYSVESAQPLPVKWLKESLDAGQALEIPEAPSDDQADKAELENHLLLQGVPLPVDYFDPAGTHIPLHRSAQIQARLSGDVRAYEAIEHHVQEHLLVAQENAQQVGNILSPMSAAEGGAVNPPPPASTPQPEEAQAPAGAPAATTG